MTGRDTDANAEAGQQLSAGESLALIERQQEEAQRGLGLNPALIYALWGAAYLVNIGVTRTETRSPSRGCSSCWR